MPVGDDQKQHVELTRDLAERFNARFGETFRVPSPYIQKDTARIFDLQNPHGEDVEVGRVATPASLWLLDEPTETREEDHARGDRQRWLGCASTARRSRASRTCSTIFSALGGRPIPSIEDEYEGRGYGDFKKGLAESW